MEIELLHRNDLAVAAARRTALDAERRSLARLADAGEDVLLQVGADRLAEPHRRRRLAFAERCRSDRRDDDVFTVRRVLQPVAHREAHLGLVAPVVLELLRKDADLRRQLPYGQRRRALRDLDIARYARKGSPRPNFGLSHSGAPPSGGKTRSLLAAAAIAQPARSRASRWRASAPWPRQGSRRRTRTRRGAR